MTKAYSYIRFSTPEQLKGDSLRRQAEASEKYALEHGLSLDTTLNLRDLGISAYDKSNLKKGALGQFIKLVDNGKIEKGSFLLVENLDRLSRGQMTEAVELFINLVNSEITIVTLMDNQIYSRETINNNMSSLLMSIVIMSRASEESISKSKRIRASWDNKRKTILTKRLTKRCPYWLKASKDATGFEFIPERVEIVKKIFQMANNGMGNSTITKRLNEEQVKPFSNKTDGWQPSYIQKVLRNPAVYGEINLATQRDGEIKKFGEPIKNYYPAIMSKEEWFLINQRRSERQTKGGVHKGSQLSNIFSGLLRCGHCKGPITMGAHTKKLADNTFKSRKFVGCSRGRRGLDCKHLTWSYKELEEEILTFCKSLDFAEVIGKDNNHKAELQETSKLIIKLNSAIDDNMKKISKLIEFVENGDAPNLQSISDRIKSLEDEIIIQKADLDEQINSANQLQAKVLESSGQHEAITQTLEKLKSLSGNDLHDLRLKLSTQIKLAIKNIFLFPGGEWINDTKQRELESNLQLSGYSPREIKDYLKTFEEPNRKNKFIVIVFKNNHVLRLSHNEVMHNFNIFTKADYLESYHLKEI
jgi:DNA invertase Pin-like site-specific DNA recombinase